MPRTKGPLTAEQVRENAERTYKHFSPEAVLERITTPGKSYTYVYGILPGKKRPFFDGPMTVEEANEIASTLINGEVFEGIETKQLSVATQQIKALLVSRGVSPDEATERVSHKRPTREKLSPDLLGAFKKRGRV